jgi:hypothetical protein
MGLKIVFLFLHQKRYRVKKIIGESFLKKTGTSTPRPLTKNNNSHTTL